MRPLSIGHDQPLERENLMDGNFQEVTDQDFETVVLESDMPVLVDFWAPWCGPCRQFAPVFESLSEQHADIVFAKVNTEEQRDLAGHFQIRSIPTLMVFRELKESFPGESASVGLQYTELGKYAEAACERW